MMKKTLSLLVLLSGLANYSNAGIIATFDFVPQILFSQPPELQRLMTVVFLPFHS